MTWLVIAVIAAIVLFLVLRNKSAEAPARSVPRLEPGGAPAYTAPATEDDELFAVIAAAVAEFEGGGEFQVLSIRPSGRNWAFTGRQELMQGRL